jgi:hypothetical protein
MAGGLTSRRTACPWEVWMDVASRVIIDAALSGLVQAVWNVIMSILLVLAEFVAVALICAPRVVVRKIIALFRALGGPLRHRFDLWFPHRKRAHLSHDRT